MLGIECRWAGEFVTPWGDCGSQRRDRSRDVSFCCIAVLEIRPNSHFSMIFFLFHVLDGCVSVTESVFAPRVSLFLRQPLVVVLSTTAVG